MRLLHTIYKIQYFNMAADPPQSRMARNGISLFLLLFVFMHFTRKVNKIDLATELSVFFLLPFFFSMSVNYKARIDQQPSTISAI